MFTPSWIMLPTSLEQMKTQGTGGNRGNGGAMILCSLCLLLFSGAAILAEVYGDAVCTAQESQRCRGHGIWCQCPPCLPDGGHMIDVYAELDHATDLARTNEDTGNRRKQRKRRSDDSLFALFAPVLRGGDPRGGVW